VDDVKQRLICATQKNLTVSVANKYIIAINNTAVIRVQIATTIWKFTQHNK
jgi:hypothetical protein